MDYKKLSKGQILSENSFFTISNVNEDGVICVADDGTKVGLSKSYVEKMMHPGNIFDTEEEMSITELADIFINNPRVAMTVAFYKKDKEKLVKDYNREVKEAVERVQNAKVSEVESIVTDLINNPITRTIPGELRVMHGRHYRVINDLGRVQFIDMDEEYKEGVHDNRARQVDPRTLQYVIVNNTKYSLKK